MKIRDNLDALIERHPDLYDAYAAYGKAGHTGTHAGSGPGPGRGAPAACRLAISQTAFKDASTGALHAWRRSPRSRRRRRRTEALGRRGPCRARPARCATHEPRNDCPTPPTRRGAHRSQRAIRGGRYRLCLCLGRWREFLMRRSGAKLTRW